MKKWIIKLLSDANGNPSTRLHLAWFFAFIVALGFFFPQVSENKWENLLYAATGLSGISVFDKKQIMSNKNDEKNT